MPQLAKTDHPSRAPELQFILLYAKILSDKLGKIQLHDNHFEEEGPQLLACTQGQPEILNVKLLSLTPTLSLILVC